MLTVSVVLISTVDVRIRIIAVYMGGVPVAEHDNCVPGVMGTVGLSDVIMGETESSN